MNKKRLVRFFGSGLVLFIGLLLSRPTAWHFNACYIKGGVDTSETGWNVFIPHWEDGNSVFVFYNTGDPFELVPNDPTLKGRWVYEAVGIPYIAVSDWLANGQGLLTVYSIQTRQPVWSYHETFEMMVDAFQEDLFVFSWIDPENGGFAREVNPQEGWQDHIYPRNRLPAHAVRPDTQADRDFMASHVSFCERWPGWVDSNGNHG